MDIPRNSGREKNGQTPYELLKRIKLYPKPVFLITGFLPVLRDDDFSALYTRRHGFPRRRRCRVFQYRKRRGREFPFFSYRGRALSVCSTGNEKRARTWRHRTDRVRKFSACKRHIEKHWSDFGVLFFCRRINVRRCLFGPLDLTQLAGSKFVFRNNRRSRLTGRVRNSFDVVKIARR